MILTSGHVECVEDEIMFGIVTIESERYCLEVPVDRLSDEERPYLMEGAYFDLHDDGRIVFCKECLTADDIEQAKRNAEALRSLIFE